jgi:hypothetical protein
VEHRQGYGETGEDVTNLAKAMGTAWELAVRRCLQRHGLDITRPWQEGHNDAGDCHVEGLFVGQMKNYSDITTALNVGLAGAIKQAGVAGLRWGVAFIKRRGKGAGEGYAVMRLDDWADVVARLVYLERARTDLLAEIDHLHRDS